MKTNNNTIYDFLLNKKEELSKKKIKKIDRDKRIEEFKLEIENLYSFIEDRIIFNFINANYNIIYYRENNILFEDIIGKYTIDHYIIETDYFTLSFCPFGTMLSGYKARVDLLTPLENYILLKKNWKSNWKIVYGTHPKEDYYGFNEDAILQILKDIM